MKLNSITSIAMAALIACSSFAVAQHGGGGGRPTGVGAGSMGAPSGTGPGFSGRSTDAGPGGNMGAPSIRSQAPSTALSNPKLDSSLTNALGKSGINVPDGNLQSACSGFKNLGQCVAAMHVAKNLNLNFSDLQGKMTGANSVSLGKAIQQLGGSDVNAKSEAKKANKQAGQDLNSVESDS
jgi:hypothetical protein